VGLKIKRMCSVCKEYREIDLDKFLASKKHRVVCGECQDGVLMERMEAYDMVYGCYS